MAGSKTTRKTLWRALKASPSSRDSGPAKNSSRSSERGNVFFTLFGAVAIVGVLGAGIMATMRGPLSTMVEINKRTQAESQMSIASKLAMVESVMQASSGDCDADGYVEPIEYQAAIPGLSGGGTLPAVVGSNRQDPWGTDYGYCSWDAGSVVDDPGCGGAGQKRLAGSGADGENYSVIAVLSAGPDRTFQSSCADHPGMVTRGGDDLVTQFDYETASAATGGLWKIKSGSPDTATIDKKIEVTDTATFGGGIDMSASTAALKLGAASMLLPDQTVLNDAACTAPNAGLLRVNTSTTPDYVEICDVDLGWVSVADGAPGLRLWTKINDDRIYFGSSGAEQVGIGNDNPSESLDVVGNVKLTGDLKLAATKAVKWASGPDITETSGNLEIDANGGTGVELKVSTNAVDIVGDADVTGKTADGSSNALEVKDSSSNPLLVVQSDGKVGIHKASPNDELDVDGSADVTGDYMVDDNTVLKTDGTMADSIMVGKDAGKNVTGDFNTIVGGDAAPTLVSGKNNIIIGSNEDDDVDVPAAGTSDYLNIGNLLYGDLENKQIGIGTDTLSATLTVNGDISASANVSGATLVGSNGVTATGGNIVASTGNISATAGDISAGSEIFVDGDKLGPPPGCAAGQRLEWGGSGWSCVTDLQGGENGAPPTLKDVLTNGNDADNNDIEDVHSMGADEYCDANLTHCFTANNISSGVIPAPGNNRQVVFNNSGVLGTSSSFVFTSSGYLGVGTSSPTSNLHVVGTGYISSTATVGGATILGSTLDVAGNTTIDTDTLIVDATSNKVGIGDATPDTGSINNPQALKLDVEGAIGGSYFCDASGNNCFTASNLIAGDLNVPGNDTQVMFNSNGKLSAASNLVYNSAGRIGMGPTTPGTGRLTVAGGYSGNNAVEIYARQDSASVYGLNFKVYAGPPSETPSRDQFGIRFSGFDTYFENRTANTAKLYLQGGSSSSGAVVLSSAGGRVGIGTNAPQATLDVVGTDAMIVPRGTTAQQPTGPNSVNGMIRYDSDVGKFKAYQGGNWQDILTSGAGNIATGIADTDLDTRIWVEKTPDEDNIRFDTFGSERAIITSAGRVGIGTSAPGQTLEVSGTVSFSSTLYLGLGSAALPSLTFSSDPDTGMFRDASNRIGLAAGGIKVLSLDSTGSLNVHNSTVAGGALYAGQTVNVAPYHFDSDTGIGHPADNNLGLYTGGSLRMRLESNGWIGIGTSAPQATLDVVGTDAMIIPRGTTANQPTTPNSVNGMIRYDTNVNKFKAYQNGSWQDILTSATGNFATGLADADDDTKIWVEKTTDEDNIRFDTFGSERAIITSAGLVGIGTGANALTAGLTVGASINTGQIRVYGTGSTNTSGIDFGGTNGANIFGFVGYRGTGSASPNTSGFYLWGYNTVGAKPIIFGQNNIERMRIESNGAVGIGTSTPQATLDVVGTDAMIIPRGTTAQQPTTPNSVNGMIRYDTNVNKFKAYQNGSWQDILTSAVGNVASGIADADADTRIWVEKTTDEDNIRFDTFGSERAIITSAGYVGIGTSTPDATLTVINSSGAAVPRIKVYEANPGHNFQIAGRNIYQYYTEANPRLQIGDAASGTAGYDGIAFNTSPSTTMAVAGVAVGPIGVSASRALGLFTSNGSALTERMRVESNGYVAIGTTAPKLTLEVMGARGAPATSGTAQTGIIRGSSTTGNGVLDQGQYVGGGSWFQSTDSTNLATNYTLSLNPNGGNVGIGTATPATTLHVSSSAATVATIERSVAGNSSLEFKNTGGSIFTGITQGGAYAIAPTNVLNSTAFAYFSSTGKVGIGTVTPAATLDVTGTDAMIIPRGTTAQQPTTPNSVEGMIRYDTDRDKFQAYQASAWQDILTSATGNVATGIADADLDTRIWVEKSPDEDNIRFDTFGSERMIITSAGLVGIGTSAPGIYKLNVNGSIYAANGLTTNSSINAQYPSTGLYVSSGAQTAPVTIQGLNTSATTGNAGLLAVAARNAGATYQFSYFGAVSNASGNYPDTIIGQSTSGGGSYVERMRITSTGNVGIGDSTPDTGSNNNPQALKLDVEGPVGGSYYCDQNGNNCFTAATVATGALAAGSDREIQFNSNGSFGSDDNFYYDATGMLEITSNPDMGAIGGSFSNLSVEPYYNTSTGTGDVTAAFFDPIASGGDASASITAVEASATRITAGAPNLGIATGLKAEISANRGGIDTGYAGYFKTSTVLTGTIANAYGVYIDAIAGTNKWALYSADATAKSYFAGNLGIGNTAPLYKLDVTGAGHFTNAVNFDSGGFYNSGSAAAPSISFLNYASTGLYASGANDLSIATGGTQRMIIASTGRVGIGTTSPQATLDVVGTDAMIIPRGTTAQQPAAPNSVNGMIRYDSNVNKFKAYQNGSWQDILTSAVGNVATGIADADLDTRIWVEKTTDEDNIRFDTFGSERAIITSAGLVGIGTSTPSLPFQVAGANYYGGISNGTYVSYTNGGAVRVSLGQSSSAGYFYMRNNSNVTTALLNAAGDSYLNGGNLGVGTTSPAAKLDSLATTEQLRLSYDSSNYTSFTVASTSGLTIDTSGSSVTVTDVLYPTKGIITNATAASANINSSSNGAGADNTATSGYQLAGSSSMYYRTGFGGGAASLLGAGASYASLVLSSATNITEATSGNHPLIAQLAVKPPTITGGAATISDTASVYISDAPNATVSGGNYALWVDNGVVKFDSDGYFGGKVGVGTSTPQATLDVVGTDAMIIPRGTTAQQPAGGSSVNGMIRYDIDRDKFQAYQASAWQDILTSATGNIATSLADADLDTRIWVEKTTDEDNIRFDTFGSERAIITSAGKIGIGTSTPEDKLHVSGGNILLDNNYALTGKNSVGTALNVIGMNNANNIVIGASSGSLGGVDIFGGVSSGYVRVGAGGAERIRVTSAGLVGIGTTSPLTDLHLHTTAGGSTDTPRITFTNGGTGTTSSDGIILGIANGNEAVFINREAGPMRLLTNNAERVRIDSAGRVGIGTTAPSATLEINPGKLAIASGTNADSAYISNASPSYIYTTNNNGGVYPFTTVGNLIIQPRTSANTDIILATALNAGTTQARLVVKNTGYIGIGTTTPQATLDVTGTDAMIIPRGTTANQPTGPNSVNGMIRYDSDVNKFKAYQNGSWQDILTSAVGNFATGLADADNDTKVWVEKNTDEDHIRFDTFGSERMIITSAGNVGIGTTSPAQKLDVNGNIQIANDGYLLANGAGMLRIGNATQSSLLQFSGDASVSSILADYNTLVLGTTRTDATMDDIIFRGTNNGGTSEWIRIKGTGQVGIGDASPDTGSTNNPQALKLDVEGPVGGSYYCDQNGNNCFTAAQVYSGATNAPGSDTQILYNNNGQIAAASSLYYSSSAGSIAVGTTPSSVQVFGGGKTDTNTQLYVFNRSSTAARYPNITVANYDSSGYGGYPVLNAINSRGNTTTSAALQSGDILGVLNFSGVGNTSFGNNTGAQIRAVAEENFAYNTNAGTSMRFYTIANGSATLTERMRINSAGNVGIGTTSPSESLDVNGAIVTRGTTAGYATSTGLGMLDYAAGANVGMRILSFGPDASTYAPISFYQAKANNGGAHYVMSISSAGNVGIGTTSPVSLLSNTTNNILDASGIGIASPSLSWEINAAGYAQGLSNLSSNAYADGLIVSIAGTASSNKILSLRSNGTTRVSVLGNGNFGIGTSTPQATLDVTGTDAMIVPRGTTAQQPTAPNSVNGMIRYDSDVGKFKAYQGNSWQDILTSATGNVATALADADNDTKIWVEKSTDEDNIRFDTFGSERMIVTSAGNVGIGTSSPSVKLNIDGSGELLRVGTDGGSNFQTRLSTNALNMWLNNQGSPSVRLQGDFSTTSSLEFRRSGGKYATFGMDSSGSAYVDTSTPSVNKFYISSSSTFLISSNGNVGIGTATPNLGGRDSAATYLTIYNATQDKGATLELAGLNTQTGAPVGTIAFTQNGFGSANAASIYGVRDPAGNGILGLQFVAGGNNAVRITSAGYVGIGTTTPQSKLQVVNTTAGAILMRAYGNSGGYTMLGDGYNGTQSQAHFGVTYSQQALSLGWAVKPKGTANSYVSSQDAYGTKPVVLEMGGASSGVAMRLLANDTSATRTIDSDVAMTELMRVTTAGAVGIGTASPAATALLDLTSTTLGFLPPRMTTAQRNAISSPATGLAIYNTSTAGLNIYNGSGWVSGGAGAAIDELSDATKDTTNNNLFMGYDYGSALANNQQNTSLGVGALDALSNSNANAYEGDNNTALGYNALTANTSGWNNTAVGSSALAATTTGYRNVAIGQSALGANTTGANNVAVGYVALSQANGVNNTAVGYNALPVTTQSNLTAVGFSALAANTTGANNTAVGYTALGANVTGNYNTGMGYNVLSLNTTDGNSAFGFNALAANTTGGYNTAVGQSALLNNKTGATNVAVGSQALIFNSGGTSNVGVGANALQKNVVGDSNAAFGTNALYNTTASYNTAMGASALFTNTTGTYNVAVGMNALYFSSTGSKNVAVGLEAGKNISTGSNNTFLGYQAGDATTTGNTNIIIGYNTDASSATASNELNIGNTMYGNLSTGNISIGTANPAATALLDLTSTTLGFLPPRMTAAQRNAIASPATGLTVYNTDANALNVYNGTSWGTASSTASLLADADNDTKVWVEKTADEDNIRFDTFGSERMIITSAGNVGIGTSAPTSGSKADIEATHTETSGATYGLYLYDSRAVSMSANTFQYGIVGTVSNGSTTNGYSAKLYGVSGSALNGSISAGTAAGNVFGTVGSAGNTGSGSTTANAFGLYGSSTASSSAATTSAYGVYGVASTSSSGAITSAYGVYGNVSSFGGGGAIGAGYGLYSDCNAASTCYGLYVEAGDAGVGANADWGVYVTGEDQNYFSGKVGIGTSAPSSKLDVNGDMRISSANGRLYFNRGDGNYNYITSGNNDGFIYNAIGGGYHQFSSGSGGDLMRITAAGNVGIGTVSPNISGYTNGGGLLTIQNPTATTFQGVLELANLTDADAQPIGDLAFSANSQTGAVSKRSAMIRSSLAGTTANNRGSMLQFYTRDDGGANNIVERMRIGSAGNVVIGDTSTVGFSSANKLYIYDPHTENSGGTAGLYIYTERNVPGGLTASSSQAGLSIRSESATATAATGNNVYGATTVARNGFLSAGTYANTIYGSIGQSINLGSGSVANTMYGLFGSATTNNSAATTTAYGLFTQAVANASATISSAFGVYSRVLEGGSPVGSITNGYGVYSYCAGAATCYGLFVQAGDAGVGANADWGVYVSGEDQSYFSSAVGIGTTAPQARLHVRGSGDTSVTNNQIMRIDGSISHGLDFGVLTGPPYTWWMQARSNADPATTYPLALNPSGGAVGIGTTSPSVGAQTLKLDVEGPIGGSYYCDQNGNNCFTAASVAASAVPGSDTQVVFNSNGSFSANSGLVYTSTGKLSIGSAITTGDLATTPTGMKFATNSAPTDTATSDVPTQLITTRAIPGSTTNARIYGSVSDMNVPSSVGVTFSASSALVGHYGLVNYSGTSTVSSAMNDLSPSPPRGLIGTLGHVVHNAASTVAGARGGQGLVQNTSSGTITSAVGLSGMVQNSSTTGNITTAIGVQGLAESHGSAGSGTITNAYGGKFGIYEANNNNITNAYGLYSYVQNLSNTTITSAYGGYFDFGTLAGQNSFGGITTGYGVYIGAVAGTSKYSLYAADSSAPSYFAGSVGVGTTSPSAKFDSLATTEQMRLSYDSSNYASFTVASNGALTIASGNTTTISNNLIAASGLQTNATAANSNLNIPGGSSAVVMSDNSYKLVGSSVNSYARVGMRGSASTTLGVGAPYASLLLGAQGITEAASGAHPLLSQLAVRALNVTAGAATVADAATVYIEDASNATVSGKNYALWVDSGAVKFDSDGYFGSNVGIGTTTPARNLHVYSASNGNNPMARFEYPSGSSGIELLGNAASTDFINFGISGGTTNVGSITYGNSSHASNADAMIFVTNSGERLRITSAGNVGIGTTSPSYRLAVQGVANAWATWIGSPNTASQSNGLIVDAGTNSSDSSFLVRNAAQNTNYFIVRGDGNVGIGTTTPAANGLTVNHSTTPTITFQQSGTRVQYMYDDGSAFYIRADAGQGVKMNHGDTLWSSASDRRLKKDIAPLSESYGLNAIMRLNPVSYHWRDPSSPQAIQLGLIAQDVQEVLPEFVRTGEATKATPDGTLSIQYSGLVVPLIKAVKELKGEHDGLAQQVQGVADTVAKLETENKTLKDDLSSVKAENAEMKASLDDLSKQVALLNENANVGKASFDPWMMLAMLGLIGASGAAFFYGGRRLRKPE